MMKKEYLKPEMLVEEFMAEIAFLDASGNHTEVRPGESGEDDGDPGANSHRGSWGDLWN